MPTPAAPGLEILDDSYESHINACRTRYIDIQETQFTDALGRLDTPVLKQARIFFLENSFNEMQKLVEGNCTDETKRMAILQHLATKDFSTVGYSDGEVTINFPPVLLKLLETDTNLLDGLVAAHIKGRTLAAASFKPADSDGALNSRAAFNLNQLITWQQKSETKPVLGSAQIVAQASAVRPDQNELGAEKINAAKTALTEANGHIQPSKAAALPLLTALIERIDSEESEKSLELSSSRMNAGVVLQQLLNELTASDATINSALEVRKVVARKALDSLNDGVKDTQNDLAQKILAAKKTATDLVKALPESQLKEKLINVLEGNQTLVGPSQRSPGAQYTLPNLNDPRDFERVVEPEIATLRQVDKPDTRAVIAALLAVRTAMLTKEVNDNQFQRLQTVITDLNYALNGEADNVKKIPSTWGGSSTAPYLGRGTDFLVVVNRWADVLALVHEGQPVLESFRALTVALDTKNKVEDSNKRWREMLNQLLYAVTGDTAKVRKIPTLGSSRDPDLNRSDDLNEVTQEPCKNLEASMTGVSEAISLVKAVITSVKGVETQRQRSKEIKSACENLRLALVGDVDTLSRRSNCRDRIELNTTEGFRGQTDNAISKVASSGVPEGAAVATALNGVIGSLQKARAAQEAVWKAENESERMKRAAQEQIYKQWLEQLLSDPTFRTDLSLALSLIHSEAPAEADALSSLAIVRSWKVPLSEAGHYNVDGIFVPAQGDYTESMSAIQDEKRRMDESTEARGHGGQTVLLHMDEIRAHVARHVAGLEEAKSGLEATRESVTGEVARVQTELGGKLKSKDQEIEKMDAQITKLTNRATDAEARATSEKNRADDLQDKLTKSEATVDRLAKQLAAAETATGTANEANRLIQVAVAKAGADLIKELTAANGPLGGKARKNAIQVYSDQIKSFLSQKP